MRISRYAKRDYLAYYVIYREGACVLIEEFWYLKEAIVFARRMAGRVEHGNFPMNLGGK